MKHTNMSAIKQTNVSAIEQINTSALNQKCNEANQSLPKLQKDKLTKLV